MLVSAWFQTTCQKLSQPCNHVALGSSSNRFRSIRPKKESYKSANMNRSTSLKKPLKPFLNCARVTCVGSSTCFSLWAWLIQRLRSALTEFINLQETLPRSFFRQYWISFSMSSSTCATPESGMSSRLWESHWKQSFGNFTNWFWSGSCPISKKLSWSID